MLIPHTLQCPEIVEKLQEGRDHGTRRRSAHRDLGRDREPTALLRVDVDERGDQPSGRIEEPDPIVTTLAQ